MPQRSPSGPKAEFFLFSPKVSSESFGLSQTSVLQGSNEISPKLSWLSDEGRLGCGRSCPLSFPRTA